MPAGSGNSLSELSYRRLLRDPHRDASEFARASLTFGSELIEREPKRSEEVFSLALETLHLPLEPDEARLASRLAGALLEVSFIIGHPEKALRAVRVEQELALHGLIDISQGQSALLQCLAAAALADLERWPEAIGELADAVAESGAMPAEDIFARVVFEVVLASRSTRFASADVTPLERNLSYVRQQSLDGTRTVACLIALAAVRLAVGDSTSANLYERRLRSIAAPDELDDVAHLVLAWLYLENGQGVSAREELRLVVSPPLSERASQVRVDGITRLEPGSDPRLWAEVTIAEGECFLVETDAEEAGRFLLESALQLPALSCAGRIRCHEDLARSAALHGRHQEAYEHLVTTRDLEGHRPRPAPAGAVSAPHEEAPSTHGLLDLPLPDGDTSEELADRQFELPSAPAPHEVGAAEHSESVVDLSEPAAHDGVDPLTGLPTRQTLRDSLARLAESSRSLMVIVFDIDRLGRLNENIGHQLGDELLIEMARRLRHPDLSDAVVARWGGDEFVVAIGDVVTFNNAILTANELREHLCAEWSSSSSDSGGSRIVPSVTMGISLTLDGLVPPDALLRNADTALQRGRATNKGEIEIYGAHLAVDAQYRFETEYLLRDALENEWFELYFQPLYSNETGRPYAAEALLRLNHPELGALSPGSFLPVAEETGLARPLGLWVIEGACKAVANYRQFDETVVVTVNASAGQLTDDFPDLVASAMARNGVRGESLVVELTEHTLLEADNVQVSALQRLKRLGIRIALDDFGTKYSSFDHLRKFPIDVVKVDQSFVAGMCTDPHDAAIVRAVVGLAEAFDFRVVAEGVETVEQLDMQRELGCHAAQGFLIGRPAPMSDFAGLLAGLSIYDGLVADVRTPSADVELPAADAQIVIS